jgi:hypothetical protein
MKIIIYKTIILPLVLYGFETLRDEHRLRVSRRIFGPKRDEVTGGWRKLHNEELHNLYSSPSIIRMIKSIQCSTNGEKRNAYGILVGKSEGKRPLGRHRRRRVDNFKMYLREIEWDGVDWIDMAQWRALVATVLNLRVI